MHMFEVETNLVIVEVPLYAKSAKLFTLDN